MYGQDDPCIHPEVFHHITEDDLVPRRAGHQGMVTGRPASSRGSDWDSSDGSDEPGEPPPTPEGSDVDGVVIEGGWNDGTDDPPRTMKIGESRADRDPYTGENVVPK